MNLPASPAAHRPQGFAAWLWLWLLAAVLLLTLLPATPAQACAGAACVGAGPRLASISSGRAGLLNTLYGSLLGQSSALNLSVGDWNALATGDVSALKTVNALQATLGVSSPATALATNATAAQILGAMASAATNDGNSGLAAALNGLALNVGSAPIKLGDLLSTDTGVGTTKINALELATGVVQLYNKNNVLSTPSAIHVSGSALGLTGLLNAVDLQAQVVEPPVIVCGPQGSSFHTATVRLRLHLDLVNLPLNVSALTALGVSAAVSLAQLDLNIVVARADGVIGLVNVLANTLAVNITPGVADIYLGTIPDTTFFDRTHPITLADVSPANIGTATITALGNTFNLSIKASGVGHGAAPSVQTLNFTGPYPQVLTAYTGANFTTNLINDLVTNLVITITPSMGTTLDNLLLGTLKTIVRSGLVTTLGTVVSSLVNPLLETLGIRLGEADVQVSGTGAYLSCSVSGSVYSDANHSSAQDSGELGIGSTLYAKLVASGTPGTAALTATVDPTTGAYSFPSVATGSYSLVICATNTQTDVTAAVPAGWLATENPSFTRALTLATDTTGLRFGVYHGSKLVGTVFKDTGNGGGTANNGSKDGAEAGISGTTIKLTDSTGATLLTSDITADQGGYTLWIPFASIGALKIAQTDSGDWVPTGGNAGTTAGSYTLASDSVAFSAASGVNYSGVNFAKVPANKFDTDGQQQTQPGKVVFYTHAYTAGTAGQLTFALATPAVPNNAGFSVLLYEDANCNSGIDNGETQLTAAKTVVAGQKVCVIAKVQIPVNASYGQQYPVALTATLAYANSAISGSQARNDLTIIGDGSDLRLVKVADKSTAATGDVITYTITYTNLGNAALSAMKIIDQTPSYTVLNAATCGTLPAGGLTCGVTTQPGAGNAGKVEWTFTGTLGSGGSGTVVLKVLLQ